METVTDPEGGVTRYIYDAAGNLVRTDLPNGTFETRELRRSEPADVPGEPRPRRRDLQLPLHAGRRRAAATPSSRTTAAASITATTPSTA